MVETYNARSGMFRQEKMHSYNQNQDFYSNYNAYPYHPPPAHHQQLSLHLGNATNGLHQPPPPPTPPYGHQEAQHPVSAEWAKQLEYAAISRQSATPHHHARAAQLQQRGHGASTSALPIIDPKGGSDASSRVTNGRAAFLHRKTDSTGSLNPDQKMRTLRAANTSSFKANGTSEQTEKDESGWSVLDMGGMQLKQLAPSLFTYTFLTALYIPHNQLTALPPGLAQLTSLVRLDASSNKLTSVPPELGTVISLRELLLFDNQIVTLPPELGTLHMLEILGVDGNPLQEQLRILAEKEGTTGLVSFLRDSCPVPMPPPEREWLTVELDNELPSSENDDSKYQDGFSVLCYNILCEKYATTAMYGYTPSWALSWEYRKELILQEVMGYNADILCLQEVDVEQYEEYFQHNLSQQDYEGVYSPKTRARTMSDEEKRHVDGCAIFYKATTFSLVEQQLVEFNQVAMRRPDFKKTEDMFNRVMTKDNIAVLALLEHRQTGARLIVANTHIHWDAEFKDVKVVQVAMLMDELKKTADRFAKLPPRLDVKDAPSYSTGSAIPTIIAGDFNSLPESGVCEFLHKGHLPKDHDDFGDHIYGTYTSDGLDHNLNLKSAYSHVGELPFTNYTPGFRGVIDYIWYTESSLAVTGVLGEVDQPYLSKVVGFPNAHYPSDHICILSEFKHRKTPAKR